jgi:hypothetical protein
LSRLLLDEPPLLVRPALAVEVGLNEALILQQLHYWLQRSCVERDGHRWVWNSYEDWQRQFPFWHRDTIKRAFLTLRRRGLVITRKNPERPGDRTNWYRIDYARLEQVEQTIGANCTDGRGNLPRCSSTENTPEKRGSAGGGTRGRAVGARASRRDMERKLLGE